MNIRKFVLLFVMLISVNVFSQKLEPGFDMSEYLELMLVSVKSVKDSAYASKFPEPKRFSMLYQSDNLKLDNSWDLWSDDSGTGLISIRGTTAKFESWLENLYAAMLPANGELVFESGDNFIYNLADNPKAGVHAGWLIGTALLYRDMKPHLDSMVSNGVRNFMITGHSQGGALALLLTSYLNSLRRTGILPGDISFKTYASAAPKPGNTYFAYEYEQLTQGGYSFNVVNPFDWVPETPITIQTLDDFNNTNPFVHSKSIIRAQKYPGRIALKRMYNKLDKPTRKAQKNYEKYLGHMTHKLIEKELGKIKVPDYLPSNNYVRVGAMIVLESDETYQMAFPENIELVFNHHYHESYLHMARRMMSNQLQGRSEIAK